MITITITITNFSRVINYNYNYSTANYHYKLLCQLLSNYMYCEFILRKIKVSKFFGFNLLRSGVKILPPWLNTLSIGADVAGTEKICFTRRESEGNSFSLTFQYSIASSTASSTSKVSLNNIHFRVW